MKNATLRLLELCQVGQGIQTGNDYAILQIAFDVEMDGRRSVRHIAAAKQIVGATSGGSGGSLEISVGPTEFGIPPEVLRPHVEAYVRVAGRIMGGGSGVVQRTHNRFCMEHCVPITFTPLPKSSGETW